MYLYSGGRPYFVITNYEYLRSKIDKFRETKAKCWDYVIVDEGQRLKNSTTETYKCLHKVCGDTTRRLMLSGKPIENHLVVS